MCLVILFAPIQDAIQRALGNTVTASHAGGVRRALTCGLCKLLPGHNTSNGWLDAMDPLFAEIGEAVGTAMQTEFGPAEFVEADGWFSLETGPWLSSSTSSDIATLAASDTVMDGQMAAGLGTCLGGFVIPTEEEAFTRASRVFSTLTKANPEAVWLYQGYPWFRVYSQGASCNQTALRLFIKGFTDAIPKASRPVA